MLKFVRTITLSSAEAPSVKGGARTKKGEASAEEREVKKMFILTLLQFVCDHSPPCMLQVHFVDFDVIFFLSFFFFCSQRNAWLAGRVCPPWRRRYLLQKKILKFLQTSLSLKYKSSKLRIAAFQPLCFLTEKRERNSELSKQEHGARGGGGSLLQSINQSIINVSKNASRGETPLY